MVDANCWTMPRSWAPRGAAGWHAPGRPWFGRRWPGRMWAAGPLRTGTPHRVDQGLGDDERGDGLHGGRQVIDVRRPDEANIQRAAAGELLQRRREASPVQRLGVQPVRESVEVDEHSR